MCAVEYDERLSVPLRWWVQGTMLVASLWLAVVVALPLTAAWLVTGVALVAMAGLFWGYGAVRLRVSGGRFSAGRAGIDVRFLGRPVALDAGDARRLAGRDADARAYFLLRPYLKRAVQVPLVDPDDPTPYWLVSTRRPDRLVAALESARTGPVPPGAPHP
jgi:hypothetical protein